ncbi:hypothetical protein AJ79_10002 [Helicocarpus griseus UAMH5409]|uniref:Uncharacterized protein n=1 Tax=Helicocarpus griseus UAMH5409 TaxID=1447875 RepID=A0A2B7W7N6_9EURO|nr:hypothetical protein AJ79_10002 [Helicocarpus griseus UAMH5409]
MAEPQSSQPETDSVSWPELFSQHESNLNRHLEICGMVKQHVVPESSSFLRISSMVDRTQELLRQLEGLRIEFMPQHAASRILSGKSMNRVNEQRAKNQSAEAACQGSAYATQTGQSDIYRSGRGADGTSEPSFVFDKEPAPVSGNQHPKGGKKRPFNVNGLEEGSNEPKTTFPIGKRKMANPRGRGEPSSGDNVSTTNSTRMVETEDISAEVEARLNAKEEKRRRRTEKRDMKRKRKSTGSNAGEQGTQSSSEPRTKKSKLQPGADESGLGKRKTSGDTHDTNRGNGGSHEGAVRKRLKKS